MTTPNQDIGDSLKHYTEAKEIIQQSLPILFLSLIGSLFAGIVLGGMEETIELIPGLIVVIPAMLDMRGNIYGALGSRLSTGLHQGLIEPRYQKNKNFTNALLASLINSVAVSILLSIFAWIILTSLTIEVISIFELTLITLLSGLISGLILTAIVTYAVFKSYRKGIDPDNVIGPAVTVSGDIFSILILFYVANIVVGGI